MSLPAYTAVHDRRATSPAREGEAASFLHFGCGLGSKGTEMPRNNNG